MTHHSSEKNVTPYQDINELLSFISSSIQECLGKNLIGFYLFGSLAYGDFNPNSSDIDLVAVVNKPLSEQEFALIKPLHKQISGYPKWGNRLECSYTPIEMFKNILPPQKPRPYYGEGIFYNEAPYGNEWIINNYLLYEYAIPLIGPNFKELTKPINIIEVQKACIRDLFQEWEPKIIDPIWLSNSHYQSYLIINLCRILYTVICGTAGTKKTATEWAKNQFGSPWTTLIETAEHWEYGQVISLKSETIDWIKFVINEIKQTSLYQEMYYKIR